MEKYNIKDDTADLSKITFARIEIVPNNTEKYPYLYPDLPWKFTVDERVKPKWLNKEIETLAWGAFEDWKKKIYTFNYMEARNPINPLLIKPNNPTSKDIENLKKWASVRDSVGASVRDSVGASVRASVGDSVRDSVGDSVGASVWDSVRASVRDSVWAYYGSLFPCFGDKYQMLLDLWYKGFVPSYDGKVWRLHAGKDAKIVYTWDGK